MAELDNRPRSMACWMGYPVIEVRILESPHQGLEGLVLGGKLSCGRCGYPGAASWVRVERRPP